MTHLDNPQFHLIVCCCDGFDYSQSNSVCILWDKAHRFSNVGVHNATEAYICVLSKKSEFVLC